MRRNCLNNKAQWFTHKDIFVESATEKGIIDIDSAKWPSMCDCKADNKTNNGGFDKTAQVLMVINVGY